MEKVIIIGTGPAGYTAAIYAARANLAPVMFTGLLPGGQLTQTTEIENFPGFPEGIQGFDLMMAMQQQAEKFGTKILSETVTEVVFDPSGKAHVVKTVEGNYLASTVIIATGAAPRWLGLPSEERLKTKGVTACATCDGFFYRDLPVVVVGGGDTAVEDAVFLTKFASSVTIIHRRDQLRASKIMADRALNNPKIKIKWNSVVDEILGENAVQGLRIKNTLTGALEEIDCKGVFVALGHIPNTTIFKGSVEMDEQGYIRLPNPNSSQTSIPGVFTAGDCADSNYQQAIVAAGMGCRAAIDAERYLERL